MGITVAGEAIPHDERITSEDALEDGLISPFDLRCEFLHDPLGIDALRPRLSWKLKAAGDARNQSQSAYRIRVATTVDLLDGEADLWDSGRVKSNKQLHVEYEGKSLKSSDRCYWHIEVWDGDGLKSNPSPIVWWEMGLLAPSDWIASWISDGKENPASDEEFYEDDPAPLFRKSFQIDKPIKRAQLFVTALGYHEFRINGEALSDHVLDPAWTTTDKRIYYTCHDLTDRLSLGENVIGAMLGNGWHNPLPLRMWGRINIRESLAVGRPKLLAQLVIEYQDGTSQTIASDETWRVADGPLLRNSVYLGEEYDARLEQTGWDSAGFDDSAWRNASEEGSSPGELRAMPMPPIRVTKTLKPVDLFKVRDGVFIFDFGQNFAGWAALNVQGPRGTTVKMRMGELLHDDGTLNPMTAVAGQIKGPGAGGPGAPDIAWQENTYTLRGGEAEKYTPRFTFHGFRYVEVIGFPGTPDLSSIEGLRLNTDVEQVGSFSCSNERFNRIQEVVQWTFLSNLFSVQSDCPAREKYGYGGDIVASSEMAIYNYDVSTFYAKTVYDFTDAVRGEGWFTETAPYVGISAASYERGAGPIGWGLAHPLLVAQLYQYYGDRRLVEENYDAARKWVDLLEENSDGLIIDRCIGDHESLDPKPIALIATAQFYQAAWLVYGFSKLLGKSVEEDKYWQLSDKIRKAFIGKFLDPDTGRFDSATQAAQAAVLNLGLAPEDEIAKAVERMVEAVVVDHDGHVATGIFGTKYLLNALTASGHSAAAYHMVDQKEFPGWGHMLENGATTLWETWRASDNTYSQNHPMFGSVSEWFFKCLGGIKPDRSAVGFDSFEVVPYLAPELEWLDVSYESVRGRVACRWKRVGQRVEMEVEVPVNATAVVVLPTENEDSILESGRLVKLGSNFNGVAVADNRLGTGIEVGSGRYRFSFKP